MTELADDEASNARDEGDGDAMLREMVTIIVVNVLLATQVI